MLPFLEKVLHLMVLLLRIHGVQAAVCLALPACCRSFIFDHFCCPSSPSEGDDIASGSSCLNFEPYSSPLSVRHHDFMVMQKKEIACFYVASLLGRTGGELSHWPNAVTQQPLLLHRLTPGQSAVDFPLPSSLSLSLNGFTHLAWAFFFYYYYFWFQPSVVDSHL